MCDVVASWSNGGAHGIATGRRGTAEEAELPMFIADKILNKFSCVKQALF